MQLESVSFDGWKTSILVLTKKNLQEQAGVLVGAGADDDDDDFFIEFELNKPTNVCDELVHDKVD